MSKVKIKASKKAMEEAETSGDFVEAPPGIYVLRLDNAEVGESKSGKSMLTTRWQPVGVGRSNDDLPERYGSVWERYLLEDESAEWKRAELLHALGVKPNQGIEFEEGKPGTVIGTLCLARVKADPDQEGNYRAGLARLIGPFDPDAADEGEDEDDDEAGAADAFEDEQFDDTGDGGGDEPDDEGDGDEDESIPGESLLDEEEHYTREYLLSLSKADMKDVADEWEVKVKKGMTKDQVADLIIQAEVDYYGLAASDDDEGDDDAGDEEDPF